MPRRVPLSPIGGLPGVAPDPKTGDLRAVLVKKFLEIREPGDPPFKRTLGDLKRNFQWDERTGTLRIPYSATVVFTIGPDALGGLPDTAHVRINSMFGPGVRPDTPAPNA